MANNQQNNIENAGKRRIRNTENGIVDAMQVARDQTQIQVDKLYNDVLEDKESNLLINAKKNNRLSTILRNISIVVSPILLRRDNFIKRNMVNDYNVTWYEESWRLTNSIRVNLSVLFGDVRKSLRQVALDNPVSKINTPDWVSDRKKFISKINTTIQQGLAGDWDIKRMSKELDIVYGFRDSRTGKLLNTKKRAAAEIANSFRVARTEIISIRSLAQKDAMLRANQIGINERLQMLSTLDDRTRAQSANMDGQLSNTEGKFKYPDGQFYFKGQQPAKWRINDRETTIPVIQEIDGPELRTRVNKAKDNKETVNFQTFNEYAKENNIRVNRFGQPLNI